MLRKSHLQQILTGVHHLRCNAKAVALAVRPSHAAIASGRARENWQSAPWLLPPSSPFRHLLPFDVSSYTLTTSRFSPNRHYAALRRLCYPLYRSRCGCCGTCAEEPHVRGSPVLRQGRYWRCLLHVDMSVFADLSLKFLSLSRYQRPTGQLCRVCTHHGRRQARSRPSCVYERPWRSRSRREGWTRCCLL
jgi:hypothetical protein